MAAMKAEARAFARDWAGRGYEKGETAQFWGDLLRRVLGVTDAYEVVKYEVRAPNGGFIDALLPDAGVLVEQKASGVDLDKPEQRQGRMVTPFEQALAYAEGFPRSSQPRFIVTCNFERFRVYDRDAWARTELPAHFLEFSLAELGEHPEYLGFICDPANSRTERARAASMRAGEMIGELYDDLLKNFDAADEADLHVLNVLCVRLVFCLFAEDAGLFEPNALCGYLQDVPPDQMGEALARLFVALDTPRDRRPRFETRTARFPYVNGGLFHERIEVPPFDESTKELLLVRVSAQTDWSHISPTIFGGIFESTLNPETRHQRGMHYTSPENIHKLIDPLFLDGLKSELRDILESDDTPNRRRRRLEGFHEKISTMSFLDPACGSGNFLTETYVCLRRLEDDCLNALSALDRHMVEGQMSMVFDAEEPGRHVSLDQFCGIEVNDFACRVAQTALWIAKLQADGQGMAVDVADPFPLREAAAVTCANALRVDWNDTLPVRDCRYVMGNPPFLGASSCSASQKAEVVSLYPGIKLASSLDYVAGWYAKAAAYMKPNRVIRAAFVSTNSVTQGEQVYPIWETLRARHGIGLDFAWDTFYWSNEASDPAHVHCVILGFSSREWGKGTLFRSATGEPVEVACLSPYLHDLPAVLVQSRAKPLWDVPSLAYGNKPADDGNYVLTDEERDVLLSADPGASRYIRRYVGAQDYLRGETRWCIWLLGVEPSELLGHPEIAERVRKVRDFRLASSAKDTRKRAEAPTEFFRTPVHDVDYLAVPLTSSERRRYLPIGYFDSATIPSNALSVVPGADLYLFGVLESQFHNAWMRVVCGRLESRYRYSGAVVYNNFPWPEPDEECRAEVERCARAVLDAREGYAGSTLAQMYDPDNEWMFPDLFRAHRALDAAVEAAYRVDFGGDEKKIVAHLFSLYAEKAGFA